MVKQSLQGMELKEKEEKHKTYIVKLTRKCPKIKVVHQPFRSKVKGKHPTDKEFHSLAV